MGFKLVEDGGDAERAFIASMERAAKATAKKVLPRAKAKAPVLSGKLRDSGEVNDAYRPRLGVAESSVDFTEDYASFVHDGYFNPDAKNAAGEKRGRFIAGQPFLADALRESETELENEAEKELRKLGCKHVRRF